VNGRKHLRLLRYGTLTWAAFWVAGLPNYYQQYPFSLVLVGTLLLVPLSAYFGVKTLAAVRPERRFALGFWLSFYFTVPFALFDWLYCGVYLGHGTGYFAQYWYLTVFYFIPWVLFLPTGWWMSRANPVTGRST
jgi:hypothetical protein